MPTVPENAPSSTITSPSSEAHTRIEYEPDEEWKLQLWKRIIKVDFRKMIASAKEIQAAELRKAPDTLEARLRIKASCKQAMQTIKRLVTKQYLVELDRERSQRRWSTGAPTNPDWDEHLFEEQRNVMRSLEQCSDQADEWSSFIGRPPPEISMEAISPAEDAFPAEMYNLGRRGSAGSIRSTGNGTGIRPSITNPVQADERPHESAIEGNDYERTTERGRDWMSRENERRSHNRRSSRPPSIDTGFRSNESLGRFGLRSASSSALQSTISPILERPLSASLTFGNDGRHYPNEMNMSPYQISPRDSYPHRDQPEDQPSARPIPERSSYSEDNRDHVPHSTPRRPLGPRSSPYSSQRGSQPTSRRTLFTCQFDTDDDDDDRDMDRGRDQERLQDSEERGRTIYPHSVSRRSSHSNVPGGSRPNYANVDKLHDDHLDGAGPSRERGRYSYRRSTPDDSQYQRSTDSARPTSSRQVIPRDDLDMGMKEREDDLVRQEVDNFRREVKRKAEEVKQKETMAGKEEGRKSDGSRPMAEYHKISQQAGFRKGEEDIRRSREGKRNSGSGGNNRVLLSSLLFTPLSGISPGISRIPLQSNNAPPITRRSTSAPTRGAGSAPARSSSVKPTSSTTTRLPASASAGEPRTSSVSYGTYPMRRSSHTTSSSETEGILKLREFAKSEQDQFRSSEDETEAKRIRDLETKMQKLEEDKREAENEVDRIKVELQRLIDKAAKEDEEVKRRDEEVAQKLQDAEKREEEMKRKEDEARRKAEELSKKEEEVMQRAARLEEDTERARQMRLETQKIAEDALKRQDDLQKKELMRREMDSLRKGKEAVAREEAGKESNTLVTGCAFHIADGDIHINGSGKSPVDKGIAKLFLKVASGAFHDSGELLDPLTMECHPNDRMAVIQEILDWLDDPDSPELVMWLHGATGAGKSAVAQTIAHVLSEQGQFSGSFFFARGSITGRGDEKRLVPTLAYQLAKYWPETRVHIAKAVLSDPAIFDLTLRRQVQDLLINPLRNALNTISSASSTFPRLYIIDGLDECRSADVQCLILQVFAAAIKSIQHYLPHKLLITSRSEMHLMAGFNNTATTFRQLSLDNSSG